MKRIQLPLSEEEIMDLNAGDAVLVSGKVYTARDAAHKRLHEMIRNHQELPITLKGSAIYYVGPTPAKPPHPIGSAGPTTASRMDAYTPELLDLGLQVMIGKGKRNEAVKEAIIRNHAVYLITCGGAGALISHCITSAEPVAFEDLLSEAIVELNVKDMPCFVGIDIIGNDIYEE